jgi:hypothetical protein
MTTSSDTSAASIVAKPSTISHSAHRSHWHLTHHYPISYRSHCHYRPGSAVAIRQKYHPGHSVNLLALPPLHHHRSALAFDGLRFTVNSSSAVYYSKAFNLSKFLIKTAAG